jgi:hypothetical protein
MEQLLADIVLMNEIAILAEQVEAADDEYGKSLLTFGSLRDSGAFTPPLQAVGSIISEEDIAWTNEEEVATQSETTRLLTSPPNKSRFDLLQPLPGSALSIKARLDHWEDPVEVMNEVRILHTFSFYSSFDHLVLSF